MDDDRRTSADQQQSDGSSTATNNRNTDEGQEPRSVVDADDLLAGYVDVVDSSQRRSSPFSSPTLRVVPEEHGSTAEAATAVRVVSPPPTLAVVPQAHAEDGPHPSPRRRGTPTAATVQRRRNRQHQVTYEDLISRPRSNPRSRTPMRYESPLDHGAFHGDRANTNDDNDSFFSPPQQNHEARTISIRPTAGLGVGVVRAMPERTHFDDRVQRPTPITLLKSSKQGPSHRKKNRWNNDNFVNTVYDLATSSSSKSRAAAEILAQAKADARHFLPVYDPAEKKRSAKITKFMEDETYRDVRDQFFAGELQTTSTTAEPHTNHKSRKYNTVVDVTDPTVTLTSADLYKRIDARLQRVVAKACENSGPACKVVESFERYLVDTFVDNGGEEKVEDAPEDSSSGSSSFWDDVLLEQPTVTFDADKGAKVVSFLFDGEAPSGGFHRLLVHAVSHFHCLKAKTSTLGGGKKAARVLVVHGVMRGEKHRLLDHLASLQEQRQQRQ